MGGTRPPLDPSDPSATCSVGGEPFSAVGEAPEIACGTAFGRYVVLSKLGSGGMGVVYAAFDHELDRKVALKFLHTESAGTTPDSRGSARLLREAQAMARLSHPNVLAVHDVGASEGRLFIAIELVEGTTLEAWLKERPRHWREIVTMFKGAGRGLAAAHAVGIVHRDFKPSNVLIGQDGRPRVTDFGVARSMGRTADPPDVWSGVEEPSDRLGTPLTVAGSLVGTPGYMAPEQYDGHAADARSDQYGFCVALHEALYDEPLPRGNAGKIEAQLISRKAPGSHRGRRVPRWLQRIVLQGLSRDPDERYPTMDALLDDLDRDRTALRRRWTLGLSTALLLAGLGIGYGQMARRHSLVCRGAERRLIGVWDDDRKRAIATAFRATGKSYAQDTWTRVGQVIDRYAGSWIAMHTEACEATRLREEQSDEVLSLRMSCLEQRLEEVRTLTDLFVKADGPLVQKATRAVQSLSPVSDCADSEALLSPVKPPADPTVRAKVDELRQNLAKAKAMHIAGKFKEALEITKPLVSVAATLRYKPLSAESLVVQGQIEKEQGDVDAAERDLRAAISSAEAAHHDSVAAEAAIYLLFLTGYVAERFDEAAELAHHAEALVERAGLGGSLEVDLLLSTVAIQASRGRLDEALPLQERAIEIMERAPQEYGLRWGRAQNYFGISLAAAGRHEEAIAQYRRALSIYESELGPSHPALIVPLGNAATRCRAIGRYREARPYAERAVRIAGAELGPEHPMAAWASSLLAEVLARQGEGEEAAKRLETSLAVLERALGPSHSDVADVLTALGNVRRRQDRLEPARRSFERAIAIYDRMPDPESTGLVGALAGLGDVHRLGGTRARAIPLLERATKVSERNVQHPLASAAGRFALARCLLERGGDKSRALRLATEARDIYAKTGPDDRDELIAEIDAWLDASGAGG